MVKTALQTKIISLALLLVFLTFFVGSVNAVPCNSCADCTAKLALNPSIELANDISSVGDCITTSSFQLAILSSKTIDCQGYSITGKGSGKGISLSGELGTTDIDVIKNCVITNYTQGIYFEWFQGGATAINNSLSNNTYGIYTYYCLRNNITHNTANNNDYGIYLYTPGNWGAMGSVENIITHNTANNNIYHGIYGYHLSASTVANNTISLNGQAGLYLDMSAYIYCLFDPYYYNKVSDNLISNNLGNGISLISLSACNKIQNNILTNNLGNGIYVDSLSSLYAGFYGGSITSNKICNNSAYDVNSQLYYGLNYKYAGNNNRGCTALNHKDSNQSATIYAFTYPCKPNLAPKEITITPNPPTECSEMNVSVNISTGSTSCCSAPMSNDRANFTLCLYKKCAGDTGSQGIYNETPTGATDDQGNNVKSNVSASDDWYASKSSDSTNFDFNYSVNATYNLGKYASINNASFTCEFRADMVSGNTALTVVINQEVWNGTNWVSVCSNNYSISVNNVTAGDENYTCNIASYVTPGQNVLVRCYANASVSVSTTFSYDYIGLQINGTLCNDRLIECKNITNQTFPYMENFTLDSNFTCSCDKYGTCGLVYDLVANISNVISTITGENESETCTSDNTATYRFDGITTGHIITPALELVPLEITINASCSESQLCKNYLLKSNDGSISGYLFYEKKTGEFNASAISFNPSNNFSVNSTTNFTFGACVNTSIANNGTGTIIVSGSNEQGYCASQVEENVIFVKKGNISAFGGGMMDFGTICNLASSYAIVNVTNACPTKNITQINFTLSNLTHENGINILSATNISYANFSGQIGTGESNATNFTITVPNSQYPGNYAGNITVNITYNDSSYIILGPFETKVIVQDCTAPNISCYNAGGNYNVNSSVNLSANATDNVNVTNVSFVVTYPLGGNSSTYYGTQNSDIWTYFNFNDTLQCGTYNYTACATDNGTTPNNSTDTCTLCNFTLKSVCGDGICSLGNNSACNETYLNCPDDCCSLQITDYMLTKTANTTNASDGDLINWTITVQNMGTLAINVTFSDTESDCNLLNITNLPPGNSSSVSCVTKMRCGGNLTNTVIANATSFCTGYSPNTSVVHNASASVILEIKEEIYGNDIDENCDGSAPRCGNNACDSGYETCSTCSADCGSCLSSGGASHTTPIFFKNFTTELIANQQICFTTHKYNLTVYIDKQNIGVVSENKTFCFTKPSGTYELTLSRGNYNETRFFTVKTAEEPTEPVKPTNDNHCGDKTCNNNETCASCEKDCACPKSMTCKDGVCVTQLYCGDKICNNNETCSTCENDCGACLPPKQVPCALFGLNFGKFIVCWYWWLLLLLMVGGYFGYKKYIKDNQEERSK